MIRKYENTDTEKIVTIWHQAFSLAHPFVATDFVEKVKIDMRNIYLPNTETWVYEKDNSILGFISMIENEIGGLFIEPNHHGKGIGTKLINYINQFHAEVEVEVFKNNKIGVPFYEKYGFKLIKNYLHPETQQIMLRMKYSR